MGDGLRRTGMRRTGYVDEGTGGGGAGGGIAKTLTFLAGSWNDMGGGLYYQTGAHNLGTTNLIEETFEGTEKVEVHNVDFYNANNVRIEVASDAVEITTLTIRMVIHYNEPA